MTIPITIESPQLQLKGQLIQRTTSNQLLGHISPATTIRKSGEMLRTALKLANLKKALFANRLTLSLLEVELTATFQRKLSENQESPAETMVFTPTTKEPSLQLRQTTSP